MPNVLLSQTRTLPNLLASSGPAFHEAQAPPITDSLPMPHPPSRLNPLPTTSLDSTKYEIVYSQKSSEVYNAEGRWFVGLLKDVPPPQPVKEEWNSTIKDHLEEALCASIRNLRLPESKLILELVLCMAGKSYSQDEISRAHGLALPPEPVVLRPTIWIFCASRRCKRKVEESICDLPLLTRFIDKFFMLRPHISRKNTPRPAAGNDALTLGSSSQQSCDQVAVFIQMSQGEGICGRKVKFLISSDAGEVTLISTLGGAVEIDGQLYGLTTGHALINHFEDIASGDRSDSEPDSESDSELSSGLSPELVHLPNERSIERPVSSETSTGIDWVRGEGPLSLAYGGKGTTTGNYSFEDDAPDNIDFCLIDLSPLYIASRRSSRFSHATPTEEMHCVPEESLTAGGVVILASEPLNGDLLDVKSSMIVRGRIMRTMKVQISSPRAPGISGSWVVRANGLCGIIYASYEQTPYLHMLPAESFFRDIGSFLHTPSIYIFLGIKTSHHSSGSHTVATKRRRPAETSSSRSLSPPEQEPKRPALSFADPGLWDEFNEAVRRLPAHSGSPIDHRPAMPDLNNPFRFPFANEDSRLQSTNDWTSRLSPEPIVVKPNISPDRTVPSFNILPAPASSYEVNLHNRSFSRLGPIAETPGQPLRSPHAHSEKQSDQ